MGIHSARTSSALACPGGRPVPLPRVASPEHSRHLRSEASTRFFAKDYRWRSRRPTVWSRYVDQVVDEAPAGARGHSRLRGCRADEGRRGTSSG